MALKGWIRAFTNTLLVTSIVILGVVAWVRIVERGSHPERPFIDVPIGVSEQTGVRITEYDAGVKVFEIRAQSSLGLDAGIQDLEKVAVIFFKEGSSYIEVSCDKASYSSKNHDAVLDGSVRIVVGGSTVILTDQARYQHGRRRLLIPGGLIFSSPDAVGQAGRAEIMIDNEKLVLADGLEAAFSTGAALMTPRLEIDQAKGRFEMPEGLTLYTDGSTLAAAHGVLHINRTTSEVTQIIFSEGVEMSGATGGGKIDGRANRLDARQDSLGGWHFTASEPFGFVELSIRSDPRFESRIFNSWDLRGSFEDGNLQFVEGTGQVCLEESPIDGENRFAEAKRGRVTLRDGEVTDIAMSKSVELRQADARINAQEARILASSRVVVLSGRDPGDRVVIVAGDASLHSNSVEVHENPFAVRATGDVQGTLQGVALLSGETAEAEKTPLRFAADKAALLDEGREVALEGNARAWQDSRLLVARNITYRVDSESLRATGEVRTSIPAAEVDPTWDENAEVQILSRSLEWDPVPGEALFQGQVSYRDPEHSLKTSTLKLDLDDKGELESLIAEGVVEITDRSSGRRVTGLKALYDIDNGEVEVSGSPAILVDVTGDQLTGSVVRWNQETGEMSVISEDGNRTVTTYHLEEGIN